MREEFQPVKGTRDFLPEEKIMRQKIVDILKGVFETFGFSPLETPSLEKWEILSRKYAGGEEILKETYRLKDQGGRELGLRYDLTVPLCRIISLNPDLAKPFKRYQIGKVWRDGPIKMGRYREFWQCDVDTVGSDSMIADAEFLKIINIVSQKLGFKAEIKINNRKILNGVLDYFEIEKEKRDSVILSLDKLEKIGESGVREELIEKGIEKEKITSILNLLKASGTNDEIIKRLKKIKEAEEGVKEIESVLRYSKYLGVKEISIVPSLARGLVYYTGTIFEAYFKDSKITSSFAAGGRYDNLIGRFTGLKKVPAVGISFGLDVLSDALKEKMESEKTVVKVFVIPIKTEKESIEITTKLRESGIKTNIDMMDRGISKNLNYVNSQGIPYCLIIGKKELDENSVKLRDMETGEEKLIKIKNIVNDLKELVE